MSGRAQTRGGGLRTIPATQPRLPSLSGGWRTRNAFPKRAVPVALLPRSLLTALLAAACAGAQTAPYAIRYESSIANSEFADIANGERFTVTFIFDNGGASGRNQTWGAANLRCAIWRMNDDASVVFTHDLVAEPLAPQDVTGSATTNASGALTGMFGLVRADAAALLADQYTVTGITLNDRVKWAANPDAGSIFVDGAGTGTTRAFRDSSGVQGFPGISTAPSRWSAPQRVLGACNDTPDPTPEPPAPPPTAVPTLGHGALALLGGALAALGWRTRRRAR